MESLTLSRHFLQPTNTTRRQYEALRAYFVDRLSWVEAARRFGYTPGSFRLLVHRFRRDPRREFFLPSARESRPHGKQNRLREEVVALRKQNLSISDISRALAREELSISPAAVAEILGAEGFARLPRRHDDERPAGPRPTIAEVADVRELDLSPRQFRTRFGGLFLFVPWLVSSGFDAIVRRAGLPGSEMVTNQLARSPAELIGRYAQRMLIENGIEDGIDFFHMDALSSAVALKVNCDLQLTLMASSLYRLLGSRTGQGYETAKSRHLFRDFVDATATVTLTERDVLVRFQKRAHNPSLLAAGFDQTDAPVPWLGRKHLQLVFG